MSQSNWPEPTHDAETEPPRWGRVVAILVVAAVAAWVIFRDDRAGSLPQWRPPEIALRGREEPPAPAPEVNEDMAAVFPDTQGNGAITEFVPLKDCLATIYDTSSAAGVEPVFAEQADGRVVAHLGPPDGGVTIICADDTMTIQRSGA
jgi:hypothetical protein